MASDAMMRDLVRVGERRTVYILLKRGMTVSGIASWMGVPVEWVEQLISDGIEREGTTEG